MTLTPITSRCAIPNRADAEARLRTVRIALFEAAHRYHIKLTAVENDLRNAIEQDRTDLIEDATAEILRLREDIRYLTEELSL